MTAIYLTANMGFNRGVLVLFLIYIFLDVNEVYKVAKRITVAMKANCK